MTKRTRKICPDCERPYHGWERHKNGATQQCVTNQARARVKRLTDAARAAGWERVREWHQVINAADIPLLIVESEVFDGGGTVTKLWAPAWAMLVAKQRHVHAYIREHAIRYLFSAPKERKLVEVMFRLSDGRLDKETITAMAKSQTKELSKKRLTGIDE